MTNEEREKRVAAGCAKHAERLKEFHGTPILMIGVGHAPGPHAGRFIVSLPDGLPLEKAYAIVTGMLEDMAARLGVR